MASQFLLCTTCCTPPAVLLLRLFKPACLSSPAGSASSAYSSSSPSSLSTVSASYSSSSDESQSASPSQAANEEEGIQIIQDKTSLHHFLSHTLPFHPLLLLFKTFMRFRFSAVITFSSHTKYSVQNSTYCAGLKKARDTERSEQTPYYSPRI